MKDKKCIHVIFFRLQKEEKSVPEVILRMVSGSKKTPSPSKAENQGRADRPQWAEPSRPAQIYYQLQLQYGLECEESYWAGVLVEGSKPHIATTTTIHSFHFTGYRIGDFSGAQTSVERL